CGGRLLSPESLTGGQDTSVGTIGIFEAEDIETVRKIWDPGRVVILPFVAATPFP
ncbi:hypothetical protein B0H11DRAFT_1951259, partial [Mycena galericulata]